MIVILSFKELDPFHTKAYTIRLTLCPGVQKESLSGENNDLCSDGKL